MTHKRSFVFQDDKSHKFWDISRIGSDITTNWGKVGTGGQSKTKQCEDAKAAKKEYDKLVLEKTSKGYVESTMDKESGVDSVDDQEQELDSDTNAHTNGDAEPLDANELLRSLKQAMENLQQGVDSGEVLDEDFIESAIAELPNELQEMLQEEAQVATPKMHPERISLKAVHDGSVAANERSEPWIKLLAKQKAKHLGDYVIDLFPVGMQVYLDKKNRVIVITYLGDMTWTEVVVTDRAEITWAWSNAPTADDRNPPWSRAIRHSNADLETLLKLADESGVESGEGQITSKSFISKFVDSFRQGMMWRNSIAQCDTIRKSPPKELEQAVYQFARDYFRSTDYDDHKPISSSAAGKVLLNVSPAETIELLISSFRMNNCVTDIFRYSVLERLCETLLKRDLPLQPLDIECLAAFMEALIRADDAVYLLSSFLGAVERYQKTSALLPSTRERLSNIRNEVQDSYMANYAKERARISGILGDATSRLPMAVGEAWVQAVETDLAKMPASQKKAWTLLFNHCVGATSATFDKAWGKQAVALLKEIGAEEFHQQLTDWLPAMNQPRSTPGVFAWLPLSIEEPNQDILRGLAWCVSLCPTEQSPRLLAAFAVSMLRKVPKIGSRSVRVGNACVMALNSIGTQDCVAKLSLLKIKVKNGTALRYIDSQLRKTAERLKVSAEDLQEMSVPAYGMEEVGQRLEPMGDFVAQVTVDGNNVELVWLKSDGTPVKSVPAVVKSEHAEELKELKADIKDIEKMISAQRDRLEGLYLENRTWTFDTWRERYLDHPLVGIFARRLIWEFTGDGTRQLAIYLDDELRGIDGSPLKNLQQSTVRLWHPIDDDAELVASWRQWLVDHQICQPFKQAYREVYLVAPAELQSDVYSNRFAAHILRQTQYRALAQARSWKVNYLGAWDGGDAGTAKRVLNAWGLSAEFWVNAAGQVEELGELAHVATDQVRFHRNDQESVRMQDVPKLVFSEVMRDVDLFVSVSTVGNDPAWHDRGGEVRNFQDYWTTYAFGDLNATGKTRYDVLQRILPRLKMSSQCELKDRFLVVRGKLRTYKIHLGSANILMEPNDQYLCIVPDRKHIKEDQTYLPFEGDGILSIILSKAILLVNDDKIKDATIVSQLKRSER